jgi:membrane associated rhomboid family serine protease
MFPIKVTQPSYSRPIVTVLLIVVNMMVFLHESGSIRTLATFSCGSTLRPAYFHAENLITHMFLHAGWMHVLGNMLVPVGVRRQRGRHPGARKYLLFYLLCGVTAGLAQVLIDPYSRIPMVGASGAIAGVMGAYLVKFPRSEVRSSPGSFSSSLSMCRPGRC